jgi:hypothetical protein
MLPVWYSCLFDVWSGNRYGIVQADCPQHRMRFSLFFGQRREYIHAHTSVDRVGFAGGCVDDSGRLKIKGIGNHPRSSMSSNLARPIMS